MTTRRSVSSISISLLLLAVPTAALAGPPETEQPADTPGLLSDGLLSDAETQRLARVEAFEVVVNPIANHSTGKNLALACSQLPEELVDVPHVERRAEDASLQAELAGGDQAKLARAIDGLRSLKLPADRSKLLAQAEAVAGQLALVGHDIADLCTRIAADTLTDPDIELLRSIYQDRAEKVLRYEQLLTKLVDGRMVAELVEELLRAPSEQAAAALLEALAVEPTGSSRSVPTPVNLGAAASTLFEGLSEFLIDRAKEETLNYIRDTLVEQICGSDLQVFIPTTCKVLSKLDPNIALAAIGKSLHSAVLEDLRLLPDRLLVLAWMRTAEVGYVGTLVRVALPMLEQAKRHDNPLAYAASIHTMPSTDCEQPRPDPHSGDGRCAETLAYLRLGSMLLRAAAANVESGYASQELPFLALAVLFELEQLFAALPEPARTRLQDDLSGLPGLTWSGDARLSVSSVGQKALRELIVSSIATTVDIEHAVTTLGQTHPLTGQSTATTLAIVAAARATIVGLAELGRIAAELGGHGSEAPLVSALARAGELVAMSDQLRGDDWGSAVLATFDLVATLVERAKVDEQTGEALVEVFDQIHRYLPLFVEIANAKSSADVKAALEAAFPAGGYRLKYRQPSVSLNAYLGGYGGGIYLLDDDPQLTWEAAMFAPIGVETSWSVKHETRKAWHLGFLIAVIDLGAITTSKFLATEVAEPQTDGTVTTNEEPAKFNIAGLLSPGAYFTVGIAESPFGLGVGASVNPFVLQQVDRTYVGGEVDSQSQRYLTAVRFGAFLAVDITMVAFGHKRRRSR